MKINLFKFSFYLILSFLFITIIFAQYRETKNVKKTVSWLLWDFSGLRLIISKIWPDEKLSVPRASTFLLWFVGIYVAFFTVASQRYENRLQIIGNKANSIISQLSTPEKKIALSRISSVQNMSIPYKPEILIPHTIFQSLIFDVYGHIETIDLLKNIVESIKVSLDGVNLQYINLEGAKLEDANLKKSILKCANLKNVWLIRANLEETDLSCADMRNAYLSTLWISGINKERGFWPANLRKANLVDTRLQGAWLQGVDLTETILVGTDLNGSNLEKAIFANAFICNSTFKDANLKETDFKDCFLYQTSFKDAKSITAEQLCRAKTLYKCSFPTEIDTEITKKYPDLLKKPDSNKISDKMKIWYKMYEEDIPRRLKEKKR